jgi:methylglyoxal/glyoxal reductase
MNTVVADVVSRCNHNIQWMHCETTVDRSGTWRESYRALERAYAEGRIASIGVSNFDEHLLSEVKSMATILPHVVQNHAEPGRMDLGVRKWCAENGVLYMPYAIQRNLKILPSPIQATLTRIASSRMISVNSVVLKYFHQTGAVVIPRSTNPAHLAANVEAVDENWELSLNELAELGWDVGEIPAGNMGDEL